MSQVHYYCSMHAGSYVGFHFQYVLVLLQPHGYLCTRDVVKTSSGKTKTKAKTITLKTKTKTDTG